MKHLLTMAATAAIILGSVTVSLDRSAPPPRDVQSILGRVAVMFDLDPAMLKAVAYQESRFRSARCSPAGACGVMQIMPDLAAEYGLKNRLNPVGNIMVGGKHMAKLLDAFDGNQGLALAAYNCGRTCVNRWLKAGAKRNGLPKETRAYVRQITGVDLQVWAGKVDSIDRLLTMVDDHDRISQFSL